MDDNPMKFLEINVEFIQELTDSDVPSYRFKEIFLIPLPKSSESQISEILDQFD